MYSAVSNAAYETKMLKQISTDNLLFDFNVCVLHIRGRTSETGLTGPHKFRIPRRIKYSHACTHSYALPWLWLRFHLSGLWFFEFFSRALNEDVWLV